MVPETGNSGKIFHRKNIFDESQKISAEKMFPTETIFQGKLSDGKISSDRKRF